MSTAPPEREGSGPDRAVESFIATQLKLLKDQLGTDSTESPTDNEIERFLKRVHLLAENPVPEILNGLLGLQIESALKKRPVVAKGIDRCVEQLGPGRNEFEGLFRLWDEHDDEADNAPTGKDLAAFLCTLTTQPSDDRPPVREDWIRAVVASGNHSVFEHESAWKKLTGADLARLSAYEDFDAGVLVQTPASTEFVKKILEGVLKGLTADGMRILISVDQRLLAVLSSGTLAKALERFARSSQNLGQIRELLAVPLVRREEVRFEALLAEERTQHSSALSQEVELREQAVEEFGNQLRVANERIAELEGRLRLTTQRLEESTLVASEPTERMRRQARIDALRPIGERICELLRSGDQDSIRSANLLEEAAEPSGLVVLNRPGETVDFDAERHRRLGEGVALRVEVLEASIGMRESDGSILVLVSALVRDSEELQPSEPVPEPDLVPLEIEEPASSTPSDLATCAIDFGTSTVLASVRRHGGQVSVIPIGDANDWMPSVLGLNERNEIVVGEEAERHVDDARLVLSVKTLLGKNESHVDLPQPDGTRTRLDIDRAVGALLFEAVKQARDPGNDCSSFGARESEFHLGCPANWEGESRKRLVKIAENIGLRVDVLDIIDEPIAAGISWVFGRVDRAEEIPEGKTLVIDFGGGTLDVAVIKVTPPSAQGRPGITVLAADAMTNAGDDLDSLIAVDLASQIGNGDAEDFDRLSTGLQQQLRLTARDLKHALTETGSAESPLRGERDSGATRLTLTRAKLDELFQPQLAKATALVNSVISSSKAKTPDAEEPTAIDNVLLTGGMSRVPSVVEWLEGRFPGRINFDEAAGTREGSVVRGLGYDEPVSELNMHRPAFDIWVAYSRTDNPEDSETRTVLYPAFTPFVRFEDTQVRTFGFGYEADLRAPTSNVEWWAHISFHSPTDPETPIVVQVDGSRKSHLAMPLDRSGDNRFKLYLDGRILIRGRKLMTFDMKRWPITRGTETDPLLELQAPPEEGPSRYDGPT